MTVFGQEERIRTDANNLHQVANPTLDRAPSSSTLVLQETSAVVRELGLFGVSTKRIKPKPIPVSVRRAEKIKTRQEKAAIAAFLDRKAFSLPTGLETAFRHSGWRYRRARVINAMVRIGVPEFRRSQFERCGSCCTIKRRVGTDEARIVGNYCHDRWCIPCQRARSRVLAASVLSLMDPARPHRFITLTMPHSDLPLKEQLQKLYKAWKRMRDMPSWTDANEGGVMSLEVKVGRDGRWHPHLHLITVGRYFAGEMLSRCWEAAVGQRARTHIKFIPAISTTKESAIAVTRYLTTYAVSPIDENVFEDESKLDEAMTALRGSRASNTFGSWRGKELIDKPPIDGEWQHVCSLDQMLTAARDREPWAMALLQRVAPSRVAEVIPDALAPP